MTILSKNCLCTLLIIFSISLLAQAVIRNSCENPKLVEVNTAGTSLIAAENTAYTYYKFIVPSSGKLRFINTLLEENGISSKFRIKLSKTCNGEEILKETFASDHLDVIDLTLGDTLIMQLYLVDAAVEVFELVYNINNTCENAQWINLEPNGQSNLIEIDHTSNSLAYYPECYTAGFRDNELATDSYYKMIVPPGGIIRFEYDNSYGISIFDNCNGNRLFCRHVESGILDSGNLNAGDTVLVQVFKRDPLTWDISLYCDYWIDDCELEPYRTLLKFNLSVKEFIAAANSLCNAAKWIDIENIAFTPIDFKLDFTPACSEGHLYADAFYKFIVPPSGAISLNRYIVSIDINEGIRIGNLGLHPEYTHYFGGLAIYNSCNEEPLFCVQNKKTYENGYHYYELNTPDVIPDLNPLDTLILQLFTEIDIPHIVEFEEVHPTLNNNCTNATTINVNQEIDCSFTTALSLKDNTLNIQPPCPKKVDLYGEAKPPYADMFFQTTVPENGSINLNLSHPIDLAIYEDCQSDPIFCENSFAPNKLITGLPPNANIIIQFFAYFDDIKDFSFCITDEPTINTACQNAKLINVTKDKTILPTVEYEEIKGYDINCDDEVVYSFKTIIWYYKLLVPPSGTLRFESEDRYRLRVFDNSCESEAFFCDYNNSSDPIPIDIDNLQPNDTIKIQISSDNPLNKYSIQEVGTLPNNTCGKPTWINLEPNGEPTLVQVDQSSNTYNWESNCYRDNLELFIDSYYNIVVPPSGAIRFKFDSNLGVSAFKNCGGEPIFCNFKYASGETDETNIKNLNPGDTLIIQLFRLRKLPLLFTIRVEELKATSYCHIDDWTALKAFYNSTNGDFWKNNEGWKQVSGDFPLPNCNLDLLYGVSLDTEGRVKCIDLDGIVDCTFAVQSGGNNLTGVLPDEINLLTGLTELCLNYNKIAGTLNNSLTDLRSLKILLLHGNKFTGEIPYNLFNNLKYLELLFISANQLTGSIPYSVGECKSLIHLGLFENRLSGGIPQNLSKLKNLQGLNLRDNKLSGSVPGELSQISTLNGLYLSNNQLTGFFDENLAALCSQLGDLDTGKHIDTGNDFEVKWSDFCTCGAGNQSIDPLYLNQQSPIKNVYQHKNDIIASDFIVGTNNQQSITFSAINVILDEGFEVKKGSSFVAEYNPCGEE